MRRFIIYLCALFSYCYVPFDVNVPPINDYLEKQAREYCDAIIEKDYQSLIRLMPPDYATKIGNTQKLHESISKRYENKTKKGWEYRRIILGRQTDIYEESNQYVSIIPIVIEMTINERRYDMNGYLIATSLNHGFNWYFYDYHQMPEREIVVKYPFLSKMEKIPKINKTLVDIEIEPLTTKFVEYILNHVMSEPPNHRYIIGELEMVTIDTLEIFYLRYDDFNWIAQNNSIRFLNDLKIQGKNEIINAVVKKVETSEEVYRESNPSGFSIFPNIPLMPIRSVKIKTILRSMFSSEEYSWKYIRSIINNSTGLLRKMLVITITRKGSKSQFLELSDIATHDENIVLKEYAVRAMGYTGNKDFLNILKTALKDTNIAVGTGMDFGSKRFPLRTAAVSSLGKLGFELKRLPGIYNLEVVE